MHSSDPKSYGTRPGGIPVVTFSTAPMGYMGASSYGMAELQKQEATMMHPTPGTSGGHVHMLVAWIVTGAIGLLALMYFLPAFGIELQF